MHNIICHDKFIDLAYTVALGTHEKYRNFFVLAWKMSSASRNVVCL